ncbi:phosphodiester glycosidase family protein [Leptolyngbya sp. AN02str]|uniref:phosphodiester glycosidase family protein n=1 Tax=Leptolyngbya sp. AN02str TaxID=3423363 RepID=UPI003D31902B
MVKRLGQCWQAQYWQAIVAIGLMLPLLVYALLAFQLPPRAPYQQMLFPGMDYQRLVFSSPRPYILHLVTVDLTTPGLQAFVTPGRAVDRRGETVARTTSQFLQEFNLQLAVNANYFYPFREKTPWDFYPGVGDRVNVVGQSISNGDRYAPGRDDWAALCISTSNRAQIAAHGNCPSDTAQAVAGREALLLNGNPIPAKPDAEPDKPYPRTAIALDTTGTTLWIAIVDGKQPLYSEGVTLAELTRIFQELGADSALNLDGGGSTTLVANLHSKPTVLNAPIHTKIPTRERAIANHLGFYSQP